MGVRLGKEFRVAGFRAIWITFAVVGGFRFVLFVNLRFLGFRLRIFEVL